MRRAVAIFAALALVGFEPAFADEPGDPATGGDAPAATDAAAQGVDSSSSRWADGAAKAFDVFPIRLLSSTAVAIGMGAFVVSVPLVGPGFQMEGIRNSWEYFVMGPYEYTFVRPLGDF